MVFKVVLVCCLVSVLIGTTAGAPHFKQNQDLKASFLEFLRQDKELSALIEKGNAGNGLALSRSIRQAEIEEENFDEQDIATAKQEGFFDRAAKFVMEVLQRFLKWINTDN